MKLGDFFNAGPHAHPVNPKPVKFTCVAKGATLPGGTKNVHKRPVRAGVTAAFVFLDGDQMAEARLEARRAVRARMKAGGDENAVYEPLDAGDVNMELTYQMLVRAVREWDPDEKVVGDPLFPNVESARELLVWKEADRVLGKYNAYVDEEHPEDAPSDKEFRGAGK
jgi:hypothetical protein